MRALDIIRKAWVQPLVDGIRWWTGAHFFDVSAWLFSLGRVLIVAFLVVDTTAKAWAGHLNVVDVTDLLIYGGETILLTAVLIPDAKRFATSARRDPFLLRDARYHVDPSRPCLAFMLFTATAVSLMEAAAPTLVLLTGPERHVGAWLAVVAALSTSPLGFLSVALGLLAGGCERSRHGTRKSSSGRRVAAASPASAQ